MTNLLTLDDVANFLPDVDTSSFSDTTLSGIISQATRRVAGFCNVKGFDVRTHTDTARAIISNGGELIVSVRARPLQSVTSIVLSKGGFSTSLTVNDPSTGLPLYNIPTPGNRVHFPNSYLYLTGTYLAGGASQLFSLKGANLFAAITYIAGYSVIPDDLKDACSLFVADIIQRRVNRTGVSSFTQGSLSMAFSNNNKDTGDSVWVTQAKSILMGGGYVRPDIF